jgi:hypothetical protein
VRLPTLGHRSRSASGRRNRPRTCHAALRRRQQQQHTRTLAQVATIITSSSPRISRGTKASARKKLRERRPSERARHWLVFGAATQAARRTRTPVSVSAAGPHHRPGATNPSLDTPAGSPSTLIFERSPDAALPSQQSHRSRPRSQDACRLGHSAAPSTASYKGCALPPRLATDTITPPRLRSAHAEHNTTPPPR